LAVAPVPAQAADEPLPQIVLNPGGGSAESGADGLRIILNNQGDLDDGWTRAGSDQLIYADTVQFCCSGVGPQLSVGGTLFGVSGAAYGMSWTDVDLVASSGSTVTSTPLPDTTGSASATLRYTAVKGVLTYTVDRTVSYTYPNDYYTDRYAFTIPEGNTDAVRFYKGGDTAPGSSDEGYGIMLTSPVRSVISLNPSSRIQVGQREVPGDKPFDGAVSQHYSQPYSAVRAGNDLGFDVTTSSHDAGFMTQWDLGSAPGRQTHAQETFVSHQGTNLTAAFRASTAAAGTPVLLDLNVVNTQLSATDAIGYTFSLPEGLAVGSGAVVNSCAGAVTAAPGGRSITLAGGSVGAAANCVTSVPVVAASAGTYTITRSAVTAANQLQNGVGTMALTVTGPALPAEPGAPTGVTATADASSVRVSWQPPAGGPAVGSYRVTAEPGSASCTTTGLSCVLGGVAGTSYTITVTALSPSGVAGPGATGTTAAVAAPDVPASPPDTPLRLTTDKGEITTAAPGEELTVIGTGFLPYSTATVVVYSTPTVLGTVTTDGSGDFSRGVTIPPTLAAGAHTLVAYGVDPSGATHTMTLGITVAAATGGTTPVEDTPVEGAPAEDPGAAPRAADPEPAGEPEALAFTGSSVDPVLVSVLGGSLLVAGGALTVVARRRRTPVEAAASDAGTPVS
jgi:hypothetical protein